jgi:two-component system, cell cycle sensor histidine kinase and response regulator CckA
MTSTTFEYQLRCTVERLLVAEDEPRLRLLLATILRTDYEITFVEDGVEALTALESENSFDLLITDIKMPNMDGMELIRHVKQRYPHLPIVVVSAYRERLEEALTNGANAGVGKPFSAPQLLQVVHDILQQKPLE